MKARSRLLLITSAVLVGLAVLLSRRPVQLYKVTVLPSLGLWRTLPEAINDRGQVAGLADVAGAGRYNLFLWDHGNGMQDLGLTGISGIDINNTGQIAGTIIGPNGSRQAFLWDPNDGIHLLATLGGIESFATGLNDRGQVVGFSHRDKNRPKAFIWDKSSGMRSLTPDERQYGKARAINDAGHVIGEIGTKIGEFAPYPSWRPCYWDSTDPPATPAVSPDGYLGGVGINSNGYVLNPTYRRPNRGNWVRLWHKDAEPKWLFPVEGHIRQVVFNDANQVLYWQYHNSPLGRLSRKYFPSYKAYYLWDPKRGKIELNDQVPRELGKLVDVADINSRGCIVGVVRLEGSGQQAGVLLEPIPERWAK